MPPNTYDFTTIEPKWQQYWEKNKTFHAVGPGEEGFDPDKPKFYVLDMFPYPSGAGLRSAFRAPPATATFNQNSKIRNVSLSEEQELPHPAHKVGLVFWKRQALSPARTWHIHPGPPAF